MSKIRSSTPLLLALTLVLGACATTGDQRMPAAQTASDTAATSGDDESDRLHDRKVHEVLNRLDKYSGR